MANQFVAIPAPAANGSGAAVDASTFGALKTVTVEPNGGVFTPFVTIEGSNELVPTHWFSILPAIQAGEGSFENAVHWLRATVSNYKGGGAPTIELGGTDSGASFDQLAAPVGNGVGAGTDVSALGQFKTVQVGGLYRGALNIEVSEDGGATYSTAFSFSQPGAQSQVISADFMRVSRSGVPLVAPGLPDVWVGAANPSGGGGGGSLVVQMDEVDVVNPATTLDFQSPGMLVTSPGGGVAKIWATLFPVVLFVPEFEGTIVDVVAGKTNNINPNVSAIANLPLAASVPNGETCIVKLVSATHEDAAAGLSITFTSQGGDTIDLYPSPTLPSALVLVGEAATFVSDGVSDWNLIAVASFAGAPAVPNEQAFIQPVDHLTDPDGFSVAFPTDFDPVQATHLVIVLTLQPPTVDDIVGIVVLSYDESQVTIGATTNYADGTIIHIHARVRTGGP